LFEQVARLAQAYETVIVIVEGEPVHMAARSWKGALGRVLLSGCAVVATRDTADTAAWLGRLARLEDSAPSQARGSPRLRRPTGDRARVAEDVLMCLPGISTVGARRLLEHFGSLPAVFAADADELQAVEGVGPVRAGTLAWLFGAEL